MPPNATATPITLDFEHICDRTHLDNLDEEMLVETLSDGEGRPPAELMRRPLADHDHLLIARRRGSEDPIGVFGFDCHDVGGVPVLAGGSAYVRPDLLGRGVMQRLMAVAILKMAGVSCTPRAIAARLSSPGLPEAMARFAERLDGATAYPVADGMPIPLHTAALVRAIARAIAPRLRFDLATSTLHGALAARGALVQQAQAGASFGRPFVPREEVLAVIDMRAMDDLAIQDAARRIARARYT
jgi:GNAT superfamily N-acetyltransferase